MNLLASVKRIIIVYEIKLGELQMLFHVTHTHDYRTCMAHQPDAREEFTDGFIKSTAENNVTILATYNNRGRHTRIWVLEAVDYQAVDKALEPILKFGDYDIMPVT